MELANPNVVAAVPAKPRWRVRFSLGVLIVICLLLGAGVIVYMQEREVNRVRAEMKVLDAQNKALREELGILTVTEA